MAVIRPTWTKTCRVCDRVFQTQSNRRVTCSIACRMWARSHPGEPRPPSLPCPVCGGPVGKRATTTYCSARCRVAAGKRRYGHNGRPVTSEYRVFAECQHCGASLAGKRAGTKFSSVGCEIREYNKPGSYTQRASRRCEYCGDPLAVSERIDRRFCSVPCQAQANQVIRRARRRGLPVEWFDRFEIFERDQWTCHLCGETVNPALKGKHPMSPSLDHLIPFAVPGSPGHVRVNVALAHLRCNIIKRERVRPEDWALHRRLAAATDVPAAVSIVAAVRPLCWNRLHDLTDPANVRIDKKNGHRICVPCREAWKVRNRASGARYRMRKRAERLAAAV
jgi:hypothetical protein